MLLQSEDTSLVVIPEGRVAQVVDELITTLDSRRSSWVSNPRSRKWLGVVLYNLIHRHVSQTFWRDDITGWAYVCLPRGSQYYSGKFLADRPWLQEVFGEDRISYRLSLQINSWLRAHNIVVECKGNAATRNVEFSPGLFAPVIVEGRGRLTRLAVKPPRLWAQGGQAMLLYYDLVAEVNLHHDSRSPAICRESGDNGRRKERPAAPQYIRAVETINLHTRSQDHLPEVAKKLMQYRLIFGRNELTHGRLYAPLTFMPREERQDVMRLLGYEENDIPACAANICYAIKTGKFFDSLFHGDDVYSALVEDLVRHLGHRQGENRWTYMRDPRGDKEVVMMLRPLVKKIMTVASGKSCQTIAQVKQTISLILLQNGVLENRRAYRAAECRWLREYKKKKNGKEFDGGSYPLELLKLLEPLKQKSKDDASALWERYCREAGLPRIKLKKRWVFMAQDFIDVLRGEPDGRYLPLWDFLFKGTYAYTQSVETMANLRLHEWAIENGIHVHTLHDAVFCRGEDMAVVAAMQKICILEAAELKRRELVLIERFSPIFKGLPEVGTLSWGQYKKVIDSQFLEGWRQSGAKVNQLFGVGRREEQELKSILRSEIRAIFLREKSAGGLPKTKSQKTLMTFIAPLLFLASSSFLSSYRITLETYIGDESLRWKEISYA